MSTFNDQYYIVRSPFGDDQLFLKPDRKTSKRNYEFTQLRIGDAPLFFQNGFRDEDIASGVNHPITDVLMDGANLVVNDSIRDKLKLFGINGFQFYPSVYIDDSSNWHEDRWFMNFYEKLDCWDRKLSTIKVLEPDDDDDEDELELDAIVKKYCLDDNLLDKIPEEKRLMFKMGGASKEYIFIHQKVADSFTQSGVTGVRLFKVADFKEGDQFRP